MVEKKQIVFDLRLSYNGPLSIEEFYKEVEKWMEEKGLQKDIKRKSEDVVSKGKKIEGVWWDSMYYKVFLKLHSLVKERLKMESEGYEHRAFAGVR